MARFALLLPREEMVEPAGRIARELEMDVVLNQSVPTERILDLMEDCRRTGADILVARGRQASILKEHTDFPVVEIQLTGLEIARLLHRARSLVSHLERPKIGVVTIPNMVGNIQGFEEIFDIELHTYFISGLSEMERGAEQAVADGMDVILGGDFVNEIGRDNNNKIQRYKGLGEMDAEQRTPCAPACSTPATWGRSPTPSAATRPICKFCWTTPSTGFWSWTPGESSSRATTWPVRSWSRSGRSWWDSLFPR